MQDVTYGDLFFILAVCLLIWGLMALAGRSRKARPANAPPIPDSGAADDLMRTILKETRTAAVVGRFGDPGGAAFGLVKFMGTAGYTVHAVSGGEEARQNESVFRDFSNFPHPPDLVIIALPGSLASPWVRKAIEAGVRALWLEKGTVSPEAMHLAREKERLFVMDHSIEEEYRRLLGTHG